MSSSATTLESQAARSIAALLRLSDADDDRFIYSLPTPTLAIVAREFNAINDDEFNRYRIAPRLRTLRAKVMIGNRRRSPFGRGLGAMSALGCPNRAMNGLGEDLNPAGLGSWFSQAIRGQGPLASVLGPALALIPGVGPVAAAAAGVLQRVGGAANPTSASVPTGCVGPLPPSGSSSPAGRLVSTGPDTPPGGGSEGEKSGLPKWVIPVGIGAGLLLLGAVSG